MIAIILLKINWHNLSTLIVWEVKIFEQRCKNNGCKNKAIKGQTVRTWLINYSSDVSKGHVQKSVAIIVTSGMKKPPKKLEFSQFLPRNWALPLETLDNNIRKYSPTICFSWLIEVTVIKDADKANQDKITVHLFWVYSSCDRNNMKSLQQQIHFNVINHWGPTPML